MHVALGNGFKIKITHGARVNSLKTSISRKTCPQFPWFNVNFTRSRRSSAFSFSLSRLITCCPSLELLRSRANLLNRRILLTRFCFCGRPEDASAIQHQLTYQIVCNCGMHNDLLSTHIFCALCFLFFHSSPPRFTFNMFRSHYKYLHGNKPIT